MSSCAFAQEVKASGAKLYIEQTTFDFGYIPGEAVISHTFYFLNKGTDSLKILSVKPG